MKKSISEKDLKLIFIVKIGFDHKGRALYEFLFSGSDLNEIWGDDWETQPARSMPQTPDNEYINLVGSLRTDNVELKVLQESDSFCMQDGIDGVIALGWETHDNIDDTNDAIENRLVFKFGDSKESVENTLYKRELILKYEQ